MSKNRILYSILTFFLCLLGIVGSCFVFYRQDFILHETVAILFSLLFAIAWGIYEYAVWKGYEKTYKLLMTGIIFASLVVVGITILELSGAWDLLFDRERLQEWIEKTGVWAPIVYIILQFLQTIVLPIPTVVTIAVGVYLFGAWKTALFSYVGCVTGSIVAFLIGRILGYKVVSWLVGKETLDEWLKKIKGKDVFFLTAMFLLPFFPDDILCFVAGLSTMSTKFFVGMIMISRVISISTTAFPLDLIPFTTWWGILLWVLIFAVVIVAMWIAYCNQDKIMEKLSQWKKNR